MSQYYTAPITSEIKVWIGVIALIMRAIPGPKSKRELANELNNVFSVSRQEMMSKIATAIQAGKKIGRFKATTSARWELVENRTLCFNN